MKLSKSDVNALTPGYKVDRNIIMKTLELLWKMKPTDYSIKYTKYTLEAGRGINDEDVVKEHNHTGTIYTFFTDKLFKLSTILEFVPDKDDLINWEKEQLDNGLESFYTKLT